ncbi:MAG: ABC transporter permease [Gemmobacter sp.]
MSGFTFTAPRRRFAGARATVALMLREMATTYGRSPGGYAWAFLEPVAGIAILTLFFSYLVRQPPLGTSFALFYATGFLPFMTYMTVSNKITGAIRFSRPLLAYPSVTYVDAILSRFLLNLLTNLLISILVLAGIIVLFRLNISIDYPEALIALAMVAVLALGIGTFNCYVASSFPAWEQIWSIVNRPLFLISGVFWLIDEVPEPYRGWLYLNPVAQVVAQTRKAFYVNYNAPAVSLAYVFLFGLIALVFGLLLLYRDNRRILNEGA